MSIASRRQARPSLRWIAVGLVVVAIGVVLGFAPRLIEWRAASSALSDAEERIASLPGVVDVTSELDQHLPSRRQIRRDLIAGHERPDGEVTVEVTVSGTADPDALARILVDVRAALHDDRLDDHEVSITYAQQTTRTQVFDGWTPLLPTRTFSADELHDVAAFALSLPEGTWLDLEPASQEQGAFGIVGPPYLGMLLGEDRYDGFTIQAPVEAESGAALLATAERLTTEAARVLDGTTAIELRTPDDMLVRTATAPSALPDALAELSARIVGLPDPNVHVELDATLDWVIEPTGARGVPTITLVLELGAASCGGEVDPDQLRLDVESAYASHDVEHDVEVRCGTS